MKKLLSLVLSLAMLFGMSTDIFAKSGDIAGKIYSTDINACINGVWVDSYNIGGKTVVIVEDITNQFMYSDNLRTLEIDDLSPERLAEGNSLSDKKAGTVVGNIYETDIKTYFRGKELTSFSLNGKMAVILEELGDDNTFSDIGGKFVWNPKNRTIVLESMHRYPYSIRNMLEEKNYNIVLTYSEGVLKAEAKASPLNGGYFLCDQEIPANSIIPVTYKGEIIGYRCSFSQNKFEQDENGKYYIKERQVPIDYFYSDKIDDMLFEAGNVKITAEDWLNYFKNHTLSTIKDSFETDEYIFLYMFSSYVMHGSDRLIKLNKADGTKTEYQDLINNDPYKHFEKVTIDSEKQEVYVTYGDEYIIDLKKDTVSTYKKVDTDIGTLRADGEMSEYNKKCAKNSQIKYKLISDGEEITVDGFLCNEYYYSPMLPLAETLDFLNIAYSFENNILTLDTKNAKSSIECMDTGEKPDFVNEDTIMYLYLDNVLLNGNETEITYTYSSGHFENTYIGKKQAKPYIINKKVYLPSNFIFELIRG